MEVEKRRVHCVNVVLRTETRSRGFEPPFVLADTRFGSKADIAEQNQTSAVSPKADIVCQNSQVC
jgi:hypothetical protein